MNTNDESTPLSVSLSRRRFVAGAFLASSAFFLGWPMKLSSFGLQPAYAEATTGDIGDNLDNYVIRLRPAGFLCMANVQNDASFEGDNCHLYNLGTSSKHLLTWESSYEAYSIHNLLNFEENKRSSHDTWNLAGKKADEGTIVHVWGGGFDDKEWRAWSLNRQSDGSYLIQTKHGGRYLSLKKSTNDENGNTLVISSTSMNWELEVVGIGLEGTNYPSSVLWKEYSSFPDGPCWMSKVSDDTYLNQISIPGTHDSGTCSIDNDSPPETSVAKCQNDYIPTQLLIGVRYFDIRLGAGDTYDPGVNHGGMYAFRKNGSGLRLSHVVDYFINFLSNNKTETIIMLVSNSDGKDEEITNGLSRQMTNNPTLFYDSNRIPALSEVRGKIVLLRRFVPAGSHASDYNYGIDLHNWDEDVEKHVKEIEEIDDEVERNSKDWMCCIFDEESDNGSSQEKYHTSVYVQDRFKSSSGTKIKWIDKCLFEASEYAEKVVATGDDSGGIQERRLFINYTSANDFPGGSAPFHIARDVNKHLYESSYFNVLDENYTDCNKFIGIVPSDFVDAALARSIYRRNYESQPVEAYSLPSAVELTYGDPLMSAAFVGGKTLGGGYYKLVDNSKVLDVASSGQKFRLVYVSVDEGGNERVTRLTADVPITVNKRVVWPSWTGLDQLKNTW